MISYISSVGDLLQPVTPRISGPSWRLFRLDASLYGLKSHEDTI